MICDSLYSFYYHSSTSYCHYFNAAAVDVYHKKQRMWLMDPSCSRKFHFTYSLDSEQMLSHKEAWMQSHVYLMVHHL